MKTMIYLLSKLLAVCAGLSLVLMLLHVSLDVVGKYLFSTPIPGTAEVVASYYMIAAVFLPLAYLEVNNRSIMVELFYNFFPTTARYFCDLLSAICSFLFFFFLAKEGWLIAVQSFEMKEIVEGAWKVVIWPSRFVIPISLAVACIAIALRFILLLSNKSPQSLSSPSTNQPTKG